MPEEVNVALAQINCKAGDKEYNIDLIERRTEQAKEMGANLVIFPELALTGYMIRDILYELAEPIPGPSIRYLEEITEKENIYVIFGMLERSEKARAVLYNTAVLLGPDGLIGKYRKMHLPHHSVFEEKRYFRQGYQAPMFNTAIGKLGLIVCYDVFFPEITRLLRLEDARFIICISASPVMRRKFFEVLTAARAIENTVFLAYVNHAGSENDLKFWGGSRIIAPNGDIVLQAKYNEEDLVVGKIDYANLAQAEVFVPTIRDLKPELYDLLKRQTETL
jgi:predicted amidohydrolase